MRPEIVLDVGEEIRWEGRPAPRCYTFRHWGHALFGFIFLLLCVGWQVLGMETAKAYGTAWLAWLPAPFVLLGVYLAGGRLVQARLEWNHVRYLITNRRLIVQRGLLKNCVVTMPLDAVSYFRLDLHGEELGTLRVHKGTEQQLLLHCIEYPRRATLLLEAALGARGESCSSQ